LTLVDDKCYLFGGGNLEIYTSYDEVHSLDLLTFKWKFYLTLSFLRAAHSASLLDRKIYLFGGYK
jgi:hypothetical protein